MTLKPGDVVEFVKPVNVWVGKEMKHHFISVGTRAVFVGSVFKGKTVRLQLPGIYGEAAVPRENVIQANPLLRLAEEA